MLIALANPLIALAGCTLIALTLSDVFQSVIVPRSVGRQARWSFYLWRSGWSLWPLLAWKIHPRNEERREDMLAVFAPATLIFMLVFWTSILILGFGAVFWSLRAQIAPPMHSFWDAAYFAGTSLLTIGFGDIVARSGLARLITICAGAAGLGVVSSTTAFLFAIFGTFQNREAFVVTLGARAGTPPSGVDLLIIAKQNDLENDLASDLREGQRWIAMVMESHLAYPHLAYFRSSHDYESWVGTLGTLLDASILLATSVPGSTGQARITYALGRHAAQDLAKYFGVGIDDVQPGIERAEYEDACDKLEAAGYRLNERGEAWLRFAQLRSTYAPRLNAMARFFQIPPLRWVGDRTLMGAGHHAPSKPVSGVVSM